MWRQWNIPPSRMRNTNMVLWIQYFLSYKATPIWRIVQRARCALACINLCTFDAQIDFFYLSWKYIKLAILGDPEFLDQILGDFGPKMPPNPHNWTFFGIWACHIHYTGWSKTKSRTPFFEVIYPSEISWMKVERYLNFQRKSAYGFIWRHF